MDATINQSDQVEIVDAAEAASDCMALVPVALPLHPPAPEQHARPDASFLTQLIATAEHAPQTCALRRATPAVAQAAYGSVTNQIRIKIPGGDLQQII